MYEFVISLSQEDLDKVRKFMDEHELKTMTEVIVKAVEEKPPVKVAKFQKD